MTHTAATQSQLSASATSLDSLRTAAARDPKAAIKETAKQFEAVFMNELMKSMRSTAMGSGLFDNSGTAMGTEMLDQQYATQMTGRPGGLADLIARQLERQMGVSAAKPQGIGTGLTMPLPGAAGSPAGAGAAIPQGLPGAASGGSPVNAPGSAARIPQKAYAEDFVRKHSAAAEAAAAETGIPAPFILAQAAHESAWGRKEITHSDGSSAHNLFGMKAGAHWKGATADTTTTEVVNGQPRKVTETFRAYASYDESFRDWARMLKTNPRYADVIAQVRSALPAAGGDASAGAAAFAQGLQRAGYATDPQYADKLGRLIGTTVSLQRPAAS